MASIRHLLRNRSADGGMSIVEVVVALMVFTVIALGVGYSAITVVRMTADARSRQVASNLATTELDFARSYTNPFLILDATTTTVLNNQTFTIVRATSWVDVSGQDVGCGSGGGTLQAKRVNVTVTWNGMLATTQPVRSDTLIAPDARINDPSRGTIRVSVLGVSGQGSPDVAVSITPVSGGQALADGPNDTNAEGCSYALKVVPGTYQIALTRPNSIDSNQNTAPTKNVTVVAGGSVAQQFQYDYWATFNLNYATNFTGAAPVLPSGLDTSYLNSYGTYVDNGLKSQINLHPFTSGYAGVAGKYVEPIPGNANSGCLSPDPAAWKAAIVNGVSLADGVRTPAVAAAPGGQVTMNVPMGVVAVTFNKDDYYLTAVSATAPATAADPGCAVPMTYAYGKVLTNGTINVALPYGSWTLYSSRFAGSTQTVISGSSIVPATLGILNGNVVTVDPRKP